MPFSNFWSIELHHGTAFLGDSAQLTVVYCTDKTRNKKKSAYTKLII